MSIQLIQESLSGAKIRVVGVGGGGSNIINSMLNKGIDGVEFIAVNTDSQALDNSEADVKIQIGRNLTKGLGTGMNDEIGHKAAEESRDVIERALAGSDMVFITAGMGGGTGTGASPEVAHLARSSGALVVAIVTKPFNFEGKQRIALAESGIERLRNEVDSLIIVPNQKILELVSKDTTKNQAFDLANKVLYNATKGISQIITKPGEINVDFADVRTIMLDSGVAMIGTGIAEGENRAETAALDALANPMLDDLDITGSKRVLVNISSNGNITMDEINTINTIIKEKTGDEAKYILGIVNDNEMKEEIMVTVIATEFKACVAEYSSSDNTMSNSYKINGMTGRITEIPDDKGLAALDTPGWKRRKIEDLLNKNLSEDKIPQRVEKKDDIFGGLHIDESDYTKPAFLRKQMD